MQTIAGGDNGDNGDNGDKCPQVTFLKVDARWMRTIASTQPKAVKSYFASFRKFFQWMGETGRVSPETVADVLTTLKDGRDHFLERVAEF